MPDSERIVKQLEADLNRAERTGEMMVCVGRKTAAAAITLLKEQQKLIDDITQRRMNNGEFD